MNQVKQIIEHLQLQPHPEGGYFRETYRSAGEINPDSLGAAYNGKRNYSTCIYFLLTSDMFSAFHRIKQDEIWHFYDGSPLRLHMIAPNGDYSHVVIGRDIANQQTPQFVVPGGYWFAADIINEDAYSLVGCTVSPGFDFNDFDLPSREMLMAQFSQHREIIERLTQ
ncbi:cupin domain-containing protein [Marinilabiliaceae bacterium JC017]|nr:cupin domain-containing protein [Marinilabiliaceae bacterium JC017]